MRMYVYPSHISTVAYLCSCSECSILVNYELAVKKAAATETLNTIVDTVKKATEDGSFGNFTIDLVFSICFHWLMNHTWLMDSFHVCIPFIVIRRIREAA